jgi:hypothetical protein
MQFTLSSAACELMCCQCCVQMACSTVSSLSSCDCVTEPSVFQALLNYKYYVAKILGEHIALKLLSAG